MGDQPRCLVVLNYFICIAAFLLRIIVDLALCIVKFFDEETQQIKGALDLQGMSRRIDKTYYRHLSPESLKKESILLFSSERVAVEEQSEHF